MSKILAIDYGSKRVGLALGDDVDGYVVTKPALIVSTRSTLLTELHHMIADEGIERALVGLPVSLAGQASAQTNEVTSFVHDLTEAVSIPVETFDERLTTQLAHRLGKTKEDDSAAAAVFLTNYLERRHQ